MAGKTMTIKFCAAPGLVIGTRKSSDDIVQTYEGFKDVMWRLHHVLWERGHWVATYWPRDRFDQ